MLNSIKKIIIPFFLAFLMLACTESGGNETKTLKEAPIAFKLHMLVFKADKKMEVWAVDKEGLPTLLTSYSISKSDHWPIGVFDWKLDEKNNTNLIYPNEFYTQKEKLLNRSSHRQQKTFSLNQILSPESLIAFNSNLQDHKGGQLLVFPNEAREGSSFRPCINCPHWTPELHASLQLHLERYTDSK